jgi:hypothetical protein
MSGFICSANQCFPIPEYRTIKRSFFQVFGKDLRGGAIFVKKSDFTKLLLDIFRLHSGFEIPFFFIRDKKGISSIVSID